MADFFDLENFKGRKELQPDDIKTFSEMSAKDQMRALAHLSTHELAFRDDIQILQTLMLAPDQVRERAIMKDDVESYEHLLYLGLGPETVEDLQDDLYIAFQTAASQVAHQIFAMSEPQEQFDTAFMADTRTRLIRHGYLPALQLFLDYDPDLNSPDMLGQNAIQTLSQTLYNCIHDDTPWMKDEFPPHPADTAAMAYYPMLVCLIEKGAHPFSDPPAPYRLKEDEIPERPELAFAALAKQDPVFQLYHDTLVNTFPETADALKRWTLQRQA